MEQLVPVLDAVTVVSVDSWSYDFGNTQLPVKLAEALHARPARYEYTRLGGDSPQLNVNKACLALENGEIRAALIGGVEATNSVARVGRDPNGPPANWPARASDVINVDAFKSLRGSIMPDYGLLVAMRAYAMIETAIRARSGRSPEQHALHMGQLFERFAKVAEANPLAWSRKPQTAQSLATPALKTNRMVSYPYTKNLVAMPTVDQSACVVLTTFGMAKRLGIHESKWIFPMGGASFVDVEDITERIQLDESPSVRQ